MLSSRQLLGAAAATAAVLAGTYALTAPTAHASPAGDGLVISEVYGAGGNSGAVYDADFVELYNPTGADVPLTGLAIHYRSASGNSGGTPQALSGTVPAHGHFLIQMSAAGSTGAALPTPDYTASPAFSMAAAGGQVALQQGTSVIATSGSTAGVAGIVDFFGGSGATSYEGAPASAAATATKSLDRSADGKDTDSNAADFALADPSPTNSGAGGGSTPPSEPAEVSIAAVQGDTDTSPYVGQDVTTKGVVTADYATGGFNGFYVQDPAGSPTDGRSDGVFVYGSAAAAGVHVGESVSVTGRVSEYQGTTEITAASGGVTELSSPLGDVATLAVPWSDLDTDAEKEAHEGELVEPTGDFTVSDNYDANYYGSFVLASGDHPMVTPTEVADAQDTAAVAAVAADNAARRITLDDGSSTNFNATANKSRPLPWLTPDNPVRVGSKVTFHQPFVLEYRYDAWNLQPTAPVTDDGHAYATFSDTRADNLAPRNVGGKVRLATFNVLNYFPTTGEEYVASGLGTCTWYDDRAGHHITDNTCQGPDGEPGPRGAATAESLARQQAKIVKAINGLGASVVSLEELENSVWFGKDRDFAIGRLVAALNDAAGAGTWAYVPSPPASGLPPLEQQDVIRTGFIYRPADIVPVGDSHVLADQSGEGGAFAEAREPLAQAFRATSGGDPFLVIVNHFKSKGSGADDGTGQGLANPARVAQAHALVSFASAQAAAAGTDKVFFTGDFNAYSAEDPVQVIEDAGYHELNGELNGGEATYSFDGMDGSLDHVFANAAARAWVEGVDVWQINAQEQVGFEYSRYNYNATDLYADDVFRASDHDPEIVGLTPLTTPTVSAKDVSGKAGQPLHALVKVRGGAGLPTGTVQVRDGSRVLGSGRVGEEGDAHIVLAGLAPGSHTLQAVYSGDSRYATASTTFTATVR